MAGVLTGQGKFGTHPKGKARGQRHRAERPHGDRRWVYQPRTAGSPQDRGERARPAGTFVSDIRPPELRESTVALRGHRRRTHTGSI